MERSPDIDTTKPVSRQHEAEYFAYCGYPYFCGGEGLWGMGAYPGSLTNEGGVDEELKARRTHAASTPVSATCEVATRSSDTILKQRTVASATWKICSSTIARGRLRT